jgi:hypothetical protein
VPSVKQGGRSVEIDEFVKSVLEKVLTGIREAQSNEAV